MSDTTINADLYSFTHAKYLINNRAAALENAASVLHGNLKAAGQYFNTSNFDEACVYIEGMRVKLQTISNEIESVKRYLDALANAAEDYLNCEFKG